MKTCFSISCLVPPLLSLSVLLNGPVRAYTAESGQTFATPEEAVTALHRAVSATNRVGLGTILGPAVSDLVNPDEVQGAAEFAEFSAAFNFTNRLVRESESRMRLEVGPNAWPFPIPLVKVPNGWQFDTAAGMEELLNRRIGRNELDVLRVLRAYVQAQREYASRDRDGDEVLEYAQRLRSSPGRTDGLFWPLELNGEISPLGPLVAYAHGEGYSRKSGTDDGTQPFHGYLFKLLTRQGKNAPGGKYDYVINGNMIGGFAMVAWPAEYGDTGVMTFIVNHQGRVHQRDLGPNTARIVSRLRAYDPDKNWQLSPD
ncbi:MAG: DUF2950 family protein [Verrucomicrobia bacterium]|nr:DUF2950 family protein [Verrucomicrobiota bacterium]